jgi:hypothetical protein
MFVCPFADTGTIVRLGTMIVRSAFAIREILHLMGPQCLWQALLRAFPPQTRAAAFSRRSGSSFVESLNRMRWKCHNCST